MDKFYETEADRIRQHIRTELSMGQRLRNWWDYHWHLVAIGAAVLAVLMYLGSDLAVAEQADYSVAWVGREYLSDETAEACETALSAFGEDRNGDGKVLVRLHQIPLDLGKIARRGSTSGQQEHANILALNADLNSCQSVLFLLEGPQAFQAFSGALLYLDGSEPLPESDDWENMVVEWAQVFGSAPEGLEEPPLSGMPWLLEGQAAGGLERIPTAVGEFAPAEGAIGNRACGIKRGGGVKHQLCSLRYPRCDCTVKHKLKSIYPKNARKP